MVSVLTRDILQGTQHTRFPVVEAVLDGAPTQPHIHNSTIRLNVNRHTYLYKVFFKRHVNLPVNSSVAAVVPECCHGIAQGDIVIMRVGKDGEGVVNMRGNDSAMADIALFLWVV